MCKGFADTANAYIECGDFINQPCKCGNEVYSIGYKCVNGKISEIEVCDKMFPDVSSLDEVCKCGND